MPFITPGGGIHALSELEIDVDKDWAGKGIYNLKELVAGMQKGDIVVFDGSKLIKLSPQVASQVLTSNGYLQIPSYAPGGLYLYRYLPVNIELSKAVITFTPDQMKQVQAAIATQLIHDYSGQAAPNALLTPAVTMTKAVSNNFTPDAAKAVSSPAATGRTFQKWPSSVQLDNNGTLTDLTSAEQSGLTKDQATTRYGTADSVMTNQNNGYTCDSTNWLAQGFGVGKSGFMVKLALQLYKVGSPTTTLTVSIKAVDASWKPTGPDLCSATYSVASLSASPGSVVTFTFASPAWLKAGQVYAIVLRDNAAGGANDLGWRYYTSGGWGTTTILAQSSDGGSAWTNPNTSYTFYLTTYMNDSDNGSQSFSGNNWECQTFTAQQTGQLRRIVIKGYAGGDWGTLTASIRATSGGLPTGSDLTVGPGLVWQDLAGPDNYYGQVLMNSNIQNGQWGPYLVIDFPNPVNVTAGTTYALILRTTNAAFNWRYDNTNPYGNGQRCYSSNAGASWSADSTKDYIFEEWYTVSDVTLMGSTLYASDYTAWGYDQPFDAIVQDIGVAGAGTYTLAWEYSQGSGAWGTLSGVTDGTNSFQNTGTNTISFTRPVDWATDTINGVTKYWVRARVTAVGSGYTQPLGTFAFIQFIT